jgi:glycerol-3-phosphate acyltransferase PlsY
VSDAAAGLDPIWPIWAYAACFAISYLLGSIPFGLVLTQLAGGGDIRKIGSGNIGATNVLRTGRKGLAAATLLLDGGKGAAAVLLAQNFGSELALVAALGSLLGHLFPVWLRFQGGKGVATTLGVWLALSWPVGLLACGTWLVIAAIFRFSSLAALVAVAAIPAYALMLADVPRAALGLVVALLVVWRHQANIGRLLRGEESRIGSRVKS